MSAERTAPGLGFLLWPKWRAVANASRSRDGRSLLRLLLFVAMGVGFMAAGFLGARWLFTKFLAADFLAELLIHRTIGIVMLFFAGLLVFSSTVTAFSSFYLADDLQLLITTPVSVGRLYLARLVDTWSSASWMMLVFAMPILAGVGPVLNAPWWFYPAVPLVVLPLTIVCAAAGSCVAMLLARMLPARRTQEVLVILAVLAFLGIYIAFRLAEPEKFLDPDGFDDLVSLIGGLRSANAGNTPSDWAVNTLMALLQADLSAAWRPALVLFTAAPAACAMGAWLARAVYLDSFALAQEGRGAPSRRRLPRRAAKVPTSPIAALVSRDTRTFFRTTSQWTQLLLIAALVVVYVFNFKHFHTLEESGVVGKLGLLYLNAALAGLVVTTVAVRFLYPAVSLEGRAFWVVQTAPITPEMILQAKIRWGMAPMMALALTMTSASNLLVELPLELFVVSTLWTLLTTYALVGMGIGLGAADPKFHIDNPAKIASGMGGVSFMFLGLLYLITVTGLLAYPIEAFRLWYRLGYVPRVPRLWLIVGLVSGALVLSLIAHHVPRRLGLRSLKRQVG